MASRVNQGIQRVLGKLEASLNSGNYYEAHQMYRTLYFRYLSQKKYEDLLNLLYDGAVLLLQHNQYESGADLGILFVDVLNKSEQETGILLSYNFVKITNMFSLMKAGSPERETFLNNALKWSTKNNNSKCGHPDLHKMIAQIFWKEKNYVMAKQHFVYSHDGVGCASMLAELHQLRGYSNEIDLFITQVVLQYLCLQNLKTAQEVFDSYTSVHPKIQIGPPFLLPLLNFIHFLLKSIQLSSLSKYQVLCQQYQLSLNRDPSFRMYLDKIAQLYFDAPPPASRQRRQGLFGNLLQSFFNGLDDGDSDTDEQSIRQNCNTASTSQATQELD